MLFTSLEFAPFLALTAVVFALLPPGRRLLGLLAASCVFYGWTHPSGLAFLAATLAATIAACAGLQATASIGARRAILAAFLVILLGSLAAFKFLPLGIAAPAGFSFYAFSAASLAIDAYRRVPGADASPLEAAAYLAWFPKILAGPIERAPAFLAQVRAGLRPDAASIVSGSQLVLWGLVKKVVIADNLAPVVDHAFGIVAYASPIELLVSVYFFAFQIYCDFSGYTDIAIGLSLLFGLRLAENFRRPYFSRSPAEFWSGRWHISLAHWFRDYLYIPLGGSRAGVVRRYANVMIVFVASGLWHAGLGYGAVGWTFLAWGALNGAYVWGGLAAAPAWRALAAKFPRIAASGAWTLARVLLTFHLVAFAWIFFRAKSLPEAWTVVRKLAASVEQWPVLLAHYPFTGEQKMGAVLIAALLALEWLDERRPILVRLASMAPAARAACAYAAIAALLLMGRWQAREFIYMQF